MSAMDYLDPSGSEYDSDSDDDSSIVAGFMNTGLINEDIPNQVVIEDTHQIHRTVIRPPEAAEPEMEDMDVDDPENVHQYAEPALDPNYMSISSLYSAAAASGKEVPRPAPYGRDQTKVGELHGPLQYEDYYPDEWPPLDLSRKWHEDMPKLQAMGLEFTQKLGQGSYGEVWKVFDTHQHRNLACKVLAISAYKDTGLNLKAALNTMLREVTIMRNLDFEHIMKIESMVSVRDQSTGFQSLFAFVFMELCAGDLTDELRTGLFGEDQAFDWFSQIAPAVHYLHANRVAHMDIKPENVLYKEVYGRKVYLLGDFGIAQMFATDQVMESTKRGGTFLYMAPEIRSVSNYFWGRIGYPVSVQVVKCDVYSLGVTLARSLIGLQNPRQVSRLASSPGLNAGEWINDELVKRRRFAAQHPLIELLHAMTHTDPNQRLSSEQVVQHEWLSSQYY